MYASIRRYEGVTDPVQAAERVKEGFVPLISDIDGFVAYFWVDAGGGVMLSTSVFDSQEAVEESNRRASAWAKENLSGVLPSAKITEGTVVAEALGAAVPSRPPLVEEHGAPLH
ncbi:MAG: hypothetical protein QM765_13515 [Myxococcales bacterium]